MTTQDFISSVLDWLLADPTHFVTAASAIAALTPTPAPNGILGKLYQIIDILALNILHAKELGTPNSGNATPSAAGAASVLPAPAPALVLLALGLAAALTACANPSPQKDVFEIRAAYDATVLVPMARYHALPVCGQTATLCKNAAVDAQLINADKAALAALNAAESAVRATPLADAATTVANAQTAISAAQSILTANDIH